MATRTLRALDQLDGLTHGLPHTSGLRVAPRRYSVVSRRYRVSARRVATTSRLLSGLSGQARRIQLDYLIDRWVRDIVAAPSIDGQIKLRVQAAHAALDAVELQRLSREALVDVVAGSIGATACTLVVIAWMLASHPVVGIAMLGFEAASVGLGGQAALWRTLYLLAVRGIPNAVRDRTHARRYVLLSFATLVEFGWILAPIVACARNERVSLIAEHEMRLLRQRAKTRMLRMLRILRAVGLK